MKATMETQKANVALKQTGSLSMLMRKEDKNQSTVTQSPWIHEEHSHML